MLTNEPLDRQLEHVGGDATRVLVIGAGVAGVTLAQLLRRHGLHPVLIERAAEGAGTGYMIALFPLAEPVIAALGVSSEYVAASVVLRRYAMRNRHGVRLNEYWMSGLFETHGDYRGLDRGALLDVLSARGGAVSHETTVTALREEDGAVEATFATPSGDRTASFDLVVAADGLHSSTRRLIVPDDDVSTFDTGWGGWVAWADGDDALDLGEEVWGAGFFLGLYPVKGRVGVFLGGPRHRAERDAKAFAAEVRASISTSETRVQRALDAVERDASYFWSLTDVRARTWTRGRTLLLGDAAAGFLPTAGIGAGMALESAWVLGTMLEGATREHVPEVLQRFERTERPRVEAAQTNSRTLAKLMFHESRALSFLRDQTVRFVPLDTALGPIRRLIHDQPHPAPFARDLG